MPSQSFKLPNYIRLDTQIKLQNDFYSYVCNNWIKRNSLSKEQKSCSIFGNLSKDNDERISNILDDWLKNKQKLTLEQKQAVIYYETLLNKDRHQINSLNSLKKIIKNIQYDSNKEFTLETFLGQVYPINNNIFFRLVFVEGQSQRRFYFSIQPCKLDLIFEDYYFSNDPNIKYIRQDYLKYLKEFKELCLKFDLNFNIKPEKILEIETVLAQSIWPSHQSNQEYKNDPVYTWSEFCQTFKFNWAIYFQAAGFKAPDKIAIFEPHYLNKCLQSLNKLSAKDIQNYLVYKVLLDLTPLISEKFEKLNFSLFEETLWQKTKMDSIEKKARQATQDNFIDVFGQAYIERYFSKEKQKDIQQLFEKIKKAFAKRLENNNWLDKKTKSKALKKLESIICIIGYSGHWNDYSQIRLTTNNLIENHLILKQNRNDKLYALLSQVLGRERFNPFEENIQSIMVSANLYEVNIKIPAGILQKPFYDCQANFIYNLGTIGHGISSMLMHHFDVKGLQYDENGHFNPLLTEQAMENFKAAMQKITITLDSKLNIEQNIKKATAQLVGLEIVLDVTKTYCEEQGFNRKTIQEALRQIFIAYAYIHAINMSLKEKVMQNIITTQSPDNIFRVNGILPHCDDFYKAFDVKKDDKLYLRPQMRAKIW